MYCANESSILFHMLHQSYQRQVLKAQAAHGLAGLGSPMLLLVLFQGEGEGTVYSQRELAREMRLSPATVGVSLKSLERDGYVCRQVDEQDARRNRVALTDKGRAAVKACGQAFRAVDGEMLNGFSPEEREQLTGFFRRMLENLGGPPDFPPAPPELSKSQCKECEI